MSNRVIYEIAEDNGKYLIRDKKKRYEIDLRSRLFRFAVNTFKFLGTLPSKKEYDVFRYQLSKSSTSMGANYEEAQGAFSKKEFASKIGICLKEAKETNYFYRVIHELEISNNLDECTRLVNESDEFQKMFATIHVKVRNNQLKSKKLK